MYQIVFGVAGYVCVVFFSGVGLFGRRRKKDTGEFSPVS